MNNFKEISQALKHIKKLQGKPVSRKPRVSTIKILRTKIWIESIIREHKISIKELSSIFYSGKESTGTVMRWLKGHQAIRQENVTEIASLIPNSDEVYNLPIFELLEINISKATIQQLLDTYTHKSLFTVWLLPDIQIGNRQLPTMICKDDSEQLFQRGDVYGFMAILILLRQAELNNDAIIHEALIKDAYRALPGFCRDQRFKERWEEFYDALLTLHQIMYFSARTVLPKKDVIKSQIFAEEHHAFRYSRPKSPIDGRFIEPEKPYREATFF